MNTASRLVRILQGIGLLILVLYLTLVAQANPNTVLLPFLLPLPTAWVVAVALLLGFFAGWVATLRRVFRLNRQNRALHQRLIKAGLEADPAPNPAPPPKTRKRSGPPLEPPRS